MSLLRMSLSGAILILAIVVIRAIAIYKLSKKVFLVFWGIAIVRLLLPVSFPAVSSTFTLIDKSVPVLDSVEKGISDFTTGILPNQQTTIEDWTAQVLHDSTPTVSILFLLWMIGALLAAGYFLVSYLRCRREFKTSLPVQNNYVKEWLADHPLRRTMEVRSLTGLSTPLTYGLIHPVILMPKNVDWENERQLQYMLFHEYVHICRLDAISKFIVTATICIHWFNPMVWVLYVLFNRDIELACDERVVHHFGGNDRAAYARTLISMEEQRQGFAPFYNYFAKNAIEERIESIMKFRKGSMLALVLALVFVAVGTVTAFAAGADSGLATITDGRGNQGVFGVVDPSKTSDEKNNANVGATIETNTNGSVAWGRSESSNSNINGDIIIDSSKSGFAGFPAQSKMTSIAPQTTIPYRVGAGDDKTYFDEGTNIVIFIECANETIPLEISLASADGSEVIDSYRVESAEQTTITLTIPNDGNYLIVVKNESLSRTQEYALTIAY